ncbi:centromere protein C [Microcebus murinus]|uniref:Centromere protein C n=1 Tax=Microcebus murinus TaxID=30608 RepID=A0A8C5XE88_MICMU|nr:centromere protein C isoform X2 [Microcebus murinus]
MAASGLDHLKNDYRRRFCRPSRGPDINTEQGQNILEILKDCFEEKSLANDLSTNSTKSVLYSTSQIKDICIQSPSKEKSHLQCQKSHQKSIPVSSRKKEASLQFTIEPSETASKSVQAHAVCQKNLSTDVDSKNTPGFKKMTNGELNSHHSEADEEFYLSVGSPSAVLDAKTSVSQNAIPSIAQKRETYTFENSVNMLSSSTEISLKTKKRLNFEDKVILKKVEVENKESGENKISERQQEKKPVRISQKRIQDSEYETQAQSKKSFSTLFLETIKRSESSPIVRHLTTAPPHLPPPNDMKLIEDEFVIDESDRSFADRSWITIPRKAGPVKQRTISPAENTALLQGKESREKHHNVSPKTLASDKDSNKAHPVENSQPSGQQKLGTSCPLTDEMENNNRSTKYEIYSQTAEKSPGSKKAIKQKQRRNFNANGADELLDRGQSNVENLNMSHIAQSTFQRNSDKNMEEREELRNDHISKKQVIHVASKKSSTRKVKEDSKKKRFSNESKNSKVVPEEVTSTVTRSRRISRHPSDWWVVKPDQSPVYSNSPIRNELSVHHNSRKKPTEKNNQLSKNIEKKTIPFRRQKTATEDSSKVQKFLNAKGSEGIIDHDDISGCSQIEPLESDKADLVKKKNLDNHSGSTGNSKDQDDMTAHNVHLKSKISSYTCKTPTDSNLVSGESEAPVLEESGPSRIKNYLMSVKKNSDVNDEKVWESSDDSRVKRSKVIPENKIHHKLVLPSNTPNVRRTKRIRLKPLEYWRGERIDYKGRPSGGFVISGILSPDIIPSKRKAKGNEGKVNKIAMQKRICLDNDERKSRLMVNLDIPLGDPLQPTRVKDPETRDIIPMDLIRPRDTYQFFVTHGELKVYKTLDTPLFSTGKLVLGPHQEKGKQHVGPDILVFYVNFGDLLCTLHETSYIITTGDSFYIPSGNYYNIKNLLNEESVLLFTQIKR